MAEKQDIGHAEQASPIEPPKPAIDTVHNDEALKVLNNYHGDETWTEQEEKKLRRKIDWKLLTILCGTYGLQYYDKAMLSQAVSLLSDSDLADHAGIVRSSRGS